MNSQHRIAFVPLARSTFDTTLAAEMAGCARRQLLNAGLDVIGPEQLVVDAPAVDAAITAIDQSSDLLLLFQASFADSSMALDIARAVDAPVILWAVPEAHSGGRLRLNSFCGINLAGHGLRRAQIDYEHLYAAPGDPQVIEKIVPLARAGYARRMLRQARVARFGDHPNGFEPCSYDAAGLRQRFGIEVERLELPQIFDAVRATGRDQTSAVLQAVGRRVAGLDQLDQKALHGTLGTYCVLRDLAQSRNFNGMAVRCWPEFFTDLGCAACGAMSLLTDEGVLCSCEADVNGTITQMILHWLSGEAAFGTDIVSADRERDAGVVWHCGISATLDGRSRVSTQGHDPLQP